MKKVINLQEYRNKREAIIHRVKLPEYIQVIYEMALSPCKLGVIILNTNAGIYEWDIMHETLERIK